MRTIKIPIAIALVMAAVTTALVVRGIAVLAHSSQGDDGLAAAKAATARFHNLDAAKANGYALLVDANKIACIANPPVGTMGIHYVNGDLVSSGKIDPLTPQALVYEPAEDGQLHLVAVEYIAFQQPWDATHSSAPTLFGQQFMLTTAPNRFGLPAFYSLHAWIWKNNPSGTFSMWNPLVHCGADNTSNAPAA